MGSRSSWAHARSLRSRPPLRSRGPSGGRSRYRPVPAAALGASEPAPMDRYVVKRPAGEAGDGGGKRPRAEEPVPGQPRWREIRAEGLSCDYRLLFGKAEADEIFRQLEEEVEYFEGEGPRRSRFAAPRRMSLPRAGPGGVRWPGQSGGGRRALCRRLVLAVWAWGAENEGGLTGRVGSSLCQLFHPRFKRRSGVILAG